MALKFTGKKKPATTTDEDEKLPAMIRNKKQQEAKAQEDGGAETDAEETTTEETEAAPASETKKKGLGGLGKKKAASDDEVKTDKKKPGFLKTGKALAAAQEAEETKAALRAESFGKMFRFYIPLKRLNEDIYITFVDGNLDSDGVLDNPGWHEHDLKVNGKRMQFVSCCDDEPDPLMEMGKEPVFVRGFTIIEHDPVDKDGKPFKGKDQKVVKHRMRPFVAKQTTMKLLQKLAAVQGGLAGCTFAITRTGDRTPSVGDVFIPQQKNTLKDIRASLMEDGISAEEAKKMTTSIDWNEELVYHSAAELKKMGIVDTQKTISSKAANQDADDLDKELGA